MPIAAMLSANPHFSSLAPEDLDALASAFTERRVHAGEVLFAEGDRTDALYIVLDGEVEVSQYERRRVHEIRRLGRGELFGMRSLIEGRRRSATCTAATDGTVGVLPLQVVTLLLNQSAPLAYAFQKAVAAQLARDLRAADQRLRALIHPRAPQG